jgi:hypothetical protein
VVSPARRDAWLVALLAVAVALPLLPWPVAPLTDLPGHIGRYRILAEAGEGPLAHHFAVRWTPVGDLGVDSCAFRQVWTIGFPRMPVHSPDPRLQWTDGESAIHRVSPRTCLSGAGTKG